MAKLQPGDRFPNLRFCTAERENQQVFECLRGKTVFYVLRYAGCPVCQLDLHRVAVRIAEFQARGAQVFAVLQSDAAHVRSELERLPFEVICDSGMDFYRALGMEPAPTLEGLLGADRGAADRELQEAEKNGFRHGDAEGNELQLPAVFIVEPDGTVSFAHYAAAITDLPSVDTMLKLISGDKIC